MQNKKIAEKFDVVVLGCGVVGLTTAIQLQALNYNVRIITKDLPPNTTSNVAAAFWYPYKAYPPERVRPWSKDSLDAYYGLAEVARSGVTIGTLIDLHEAIVDDPEWLSMARRFQRLPVDQLPPGYQCAFAVEVPIIESSVFLNYLMEKYTMNGGTIECIPAGVKTISEIAADNRLIINCTGLGSRELCQDEALYPIAGQIVRIARPANLDRCYFDEHGSNAPSYIVPRSNDCILGGTADEGNWDLSVSAHIAEEIIRKCSLILPTLSPVTVLEHKVGLRPARKEVRLEGQEISAHCRVIHNYGHGGSGFTLAWGCAKEVARIAENYLAIDLYRLSFK